MDKMHKASPPSSRQTGVRLRIKGRVVKYTKKGKSSSYIPQPLHQRHFLTLNEQQIKIDGEELNEGEEKGSYSSLSAGDISQEDENKYVNSLNRKESVDEEEIVERGKKASVSEEADVDDETYMSDECEGNDDKMEVAQEEDYYEDDECSEGDDDSKETCQKEDAVEKMEESAEVDASGENFNEKKEDSPECDGEVECEDEPVEDDGDNVDDDIMIINEETGSNSLEAFDESGKQQVQEDCVGDSEGHPEQRLAECHLENNQPNYEGEESDELTRVTHCLAIDDEIERSGHKIICGINLKYVAQLRQKFILMSEAIHSDTPLKYQSLEVTPNGLVIQQMIGEGSYGHVYRVIDPQTERLFALKVSKDEERTKVSPEEARILIKLNMMDLAHQKSVVRLIHQYNSDGLHHTIFEYLPCSLRKRINNFLRDPLSSYININEIKTIAYQLLDGLQFLYKYKIIHCDIKPENIMYNVDYSKLKIIDFGIAMEGRNISYRVIQTMYYRSPEIIAKYPHFTSAVDIWSLGCVLAECFSGQVLFPGRSEGTMMKAMVDALGSIPPSYWDKGTRKGTLKKLIQTYKPHLTSSDDKVHSDNHIPPGLLALISRPELKSYPDLSKPFPHSIPNCGQTEIATLIKQMLTYDPKERISAEAALKSSFFESQVSAEIDNNNSR